jgi:hypothetical protein
MNKHSGFRVIVLFLLLFSISLSLVIDIRMIIRNQNPFQDYKAINNINQYFVNDTLIINNIEILKGDNHNSNSNTTTIYGNVLSDGKPKKITYSYLDNFYEKLIFKHIYNGKEAKVLKVIRNRISGNILIKNTKLLEHEKRDILTNIYCVYSLIPSLIIFILLIKKRK